MNPSRFALLACLIAGITACNREPAPGSVDQVAEQRTPAAPAPASASATVDPNAINDALTGDAFRANISIAKAPHASATGAGVDIVIKVANDGTSALYGVGTKPVNLGIQILGDNDDVTGSGGVRDFMRTPLPYVSAGTQADVVVSVPADPRLEGRKLRIALVQEAVGWHDTTPEQRIDLGPFTLCGPQVCDAAGAALAN